MMMMIRMVMMMMTMMMMMMMKHVYDARADRTKWLPRLIGRRDSKRP